MFTILAITDSDKHFASAISEYTKRLGKTVQLHDVKPTKNGTPDQIIAKDTENVVKLLQEKYTQHHKIMLSIEGKTIDTQKFHKLCASQDHILFIIGGPYGLDEQALAPHIQDKISFGAATMPHGLVKLVLLEQVYRAETIRVGKKYHY